MDWNKVGKSVGRAAIRGTAAFAEQMSRSANQLSREEGFSEEKREGYRNTAEKMRKNARELREYSDHCFDDQDDDIY